MAQRYNSSNSPAPNALAKALGYVSSAVNFAFPKNEGGDAALKARPRRISGMFDSILTDMSKNVVNSNPLVQMDSEERMLRLAITSTWLHSDINLIANRVSRRDARPMVVKYVSGQRKPNVLYDHPFNILMAKPNPLMSGSDLFRRTVWWLELTGNAYWFIGCYNFGTGQPVELWPLPASKITPMPETKHAGAGVWAGRELINYKFSINGKERILAGESIIPFQDPNPLDDWVGLSKLSAAKIALETDEAQRNFLRSYYKDGVRPASIISLPRETEETDFIELRRQIIEQYRGGSKDAIIRAGDFTVEAVQATIDSLGFDSTRTMTKQEIDRLYMIPSNYADGTGDSSSAIFFATNAVQPRLDMMAETITLNLAPYYGEDFLLESADVVPQERALDVQEYNVFAQDLTSNEARDKQGVSSLKPILVDFNGTQIDLVNEVPVRLLGQIVSMVMGQAAAEASETAQQEAGEAAQESDPQAKRAVAQQNQEKSQPKTGDMTQQSHYERETTRQALKSDLDETEVVTYSPAELQGIKAELAKWKKICRKETDAGKNPLEREFVTEIIPASMKSLVLENLSNNFSLDIAFNVIPTTSTEQEQL